MDTEAAQSSVDSIEEEARKLSSFKDSGKGPYLFQIPPPRLPEMNESIIKMSVIHIEDPNKFWCHRVDDKSQQNYKQINQINNSPLQCVSQSVPIQKGQLVMAPYDMGGLSPHYYRAKVLSIHRAAPGAPTSSTQILVCFIDFGNAIQVPRGDLKIMPEALMSFATLAIECRLNGIGPKLINDLKGNGPKRQWIGSPAVHSIRYKEKYVFL